MGYPNPGPGAGILGSGFFEPLSLSESICRSVRPRLSGEAAGAAAKAGHGLFRLVCRRYIFVYGFCRVRRVCPRVFHRLRCPFCTDHPLFVRPGDEKIRFRHRLRASVPGWLCGSSPGPGSAHQYVGPVPDGVPVFPLCGRAVRRSDRWRCPRQGGDMVEEYSGCALPACSRALPFDGRGIPEITSFWGKRCSACSWRCRCCSW